MSVLVETQSLPVVERVERATGRPLDPEAFKAHLKARYLARGVAWRFGTSSSSALGTRRA